MDELDSVETGEKRDRFYDEGKNGLTTPSKIIIYTSLPKVGGHSTITLALCELLVDRVGAIEVIVKETPGHGTSDLAISALRSMGCMVQILRSHFQTVISIARTAFCRQLLPRQFTSVTYISIGMRQVSVYLAWALLPDRSVYYYITHELSESNAALLDRFGKVFDVLLFISPTTKKMYDSIRYGRATKASTAEAFQPTEFVSMQSERKQYDGPVRFGFVGRLNEAKGSAVLCRFAREATIDCELKVAGVGDYTAEFAALQETKLACRVTYMGHYDPSERQAFLQRFFAEVDYLVVPSQDDREGIPTVILESLQFGVPIIATRSGGMRAFEEVDSLRSRFAIRLVANEELAEKLKEVAASGPPSEQAVDESRNLFCRAFSNENVWAQWNAALFDNTHLIRKDITATRGSQYK